MTRAGDSRTSSVSGLKARPHSATILPSSGPRMRRSLSYTIFFCSSFTRSTASTMRIGLPYSRPVRARAFTSFGKHEPPYPQPG